MQHELARMGLTVLHTSTETNLLFSTEDLIVIITIARLKKKKNICMDDLSTIRAKPEI